MEFTNLNKLTGTAVKLSELNTEQLEELQAALNKILDYNLDVDGIYGEKTQTAYSLFKEQNHQAAPEYISSGTVGLMKDILKDMANQPQESKVLSDDHLTPHFTLTELTKSGTAERHGWRNQPNQREIANLKLLCEKVLEPLRAHYNKPVVITSGFRSKRVNDAVGSTDRSQHRQGQAADFTVPTVDNYSVAVWIRDNLNYDQLILEFYTGGNSGWIHVGYSTRHKNQELTINRNGTFNGLKKY